MVRDDYAGDDATPSLVDRSTSVTFLVSAESEPLIVSRIGNQLALSNLAPSFFKMTAVDDIHVVVEATITGVSVAQADLIRRKLLQLSCVLDVILGDRSE